jgi:hypothetical protein
MSAADGWGYFDDAAGAVDVSPAEIDRQIASTFTTPDGAVVLAWLRRATIEQPCWVPGQDASHGFAREGQNSIVREIEARMRRALSASPATTPTTGE